ncbi:hypothetical protein BBM40_01080 [Vibrio parahaemolyticus]|uniref:hypothetical protein n=1 Tax=Vibrio parahaemolyticus TaxID=670 RepID=UPI00084B3423|nr:hypothetical protein [Vibrio parahaemolyticus]ODZ55724.1 hypothetical protein BBM40_01080 [Vibrio parahaemolyticus]
MQNIEVYKLDRLPTVATKDLHVFYQLLEQVSDIVIKECVVHYPDYRTNLVCAAAMSLYISFMKGFTDICKKYNLECNAESISELQELIEQQPKWELGVLPDNELTKIQPDYNELSAEDQQTKFIHVVSFYALLNMDLLQLVIEENQHYSAD